MRIDGRPPWLNQRAWRMIGGAAIGGCAALAFFGDHAIGPTIPIWFRAAYWGGLLLLLGVALYMVVLDLHFIRLEYLLARREIFHETLGETSFREALGKADRQERGNGQDLGGA